MMIEKEEGEDITESLMKNIYKEKDIENFTGIKNYNSKDYLSQKNIIKKNLVKVYIKNYLFIKKEYIQWIG